MTKLFQDPTPPDKAEDRIPHRALHPGTCPQTGTEHLYRAFIDNNPNGFFSVDAAGRFTAANPACQRICGYTESELLLLDFQRLCVPEQLEQVFAWFQEGLGGASRTREMAMIHKLGHRVQLRLTGVPITTDGQIVGLYCMAEDITAQQKAQDALRMREEQLRNLGDNIPAGAIYQLICQPDGSMVYAYMSAGIERITGMTAEHVLAAPDAFRALIFDEDRERLATAEAESIRNLTHLDCELRQRTIVGQMRWVHYRSTPRRLEDGSIIWDGVVTDITERKAAEEALRKSEARLRHLMDLVPFPIGVVGRNGQTRFFNRSFTQVFGYTQADLPTLEAWWQHAYPDPAYRRWVMENWQAKIGRAAQTRIETAPEELSVTCKDGSVRVVVISNMIIEDDILATFFDVTERKKTEEELSRSRQRLAIALEIALLSTWEYVPSTGITTFDQRCSDLFGISQRHSMTLEEFLLFVHPEDRDQVAAGVRNALDPAGTGLYDAEYRILRPDGTQRWLAARGHASFGQDGQAVGFIGTVMDISGPKQAEEAQYQANEQLRAADRQKDEFLAMLAHELRNPLAPVRNAVQVLRLTGSQDPRAVRQKDIIDRQVTHMARLLDDLLDVSRVTRGKITLDCMSLSIIDVLAQAVETATPLIQSRRQELIYTPPAEELRVNGDIDRLAQVFGNLLANAAKYTTEGGRIWLEARRVESQAEVRVRDTGIGIASELLPRVFELFAQADHSLAHAQGGLGIGLTMVQKLVQMHGGMVEAHSAGLGQGSEFIVRLPAIRADAVAELEPQPVVFPVGEKKPRRILVVDDVVDSATSLTELLSLWGHEVTAVHDGLTAIATVRTWQPEVLLLDIGMPGIDGYETARRLRAEHGRERLFVVALTGFGQETDREAAREAGFDAHLVKPVDGATLRDLLARIPF